MAPTTLKNAYYIATELAKIVCANPACTIYPNEQSANDIANFIDTIAKRLSAEPDSED